MEVSFIMSNQYFTSKDPVLSSILKEANVSILIISRTIPAIEIYIMRHILKIDVFILYISKAHVGNFMIIDYVSVFTRNRRVLSLLNCYRSDRSVVIFNYSLFILKMFFNMWLQKPYYNIYTYIVILHTFFIKWLFRILIM